VAAPTRILLEGRPGVGKTTVTDRLADLLRARDVPVRGFVTRELREHGRRVGFALETLDGASGILAHVELPGPPRVGRYGVDQEALERLAVPVIGQASRSEVVLVDEIGRMELASEAFRDAVTDLFERPVSVVATVMSKRHPFADELKNRPDVDRVAVTAANRDALPEELVRRVG
jgi:nucleoside-triphosphatase